MSLFDSGGSNISLAFDIPFPSNVTSGPGIKVDKTSSVWSVSLDTTSLTDGGVPATPSNVYLAGYDTALLRYEKLRLDNIIAGATGLDARTPRGDGDYSILITDRYIGLTAALTAVRTWTLPAANTVPGGRIVNIQDEAGGISSTNFLTFVPTGADTINGGGSFTFKGARGALSFRSDGTSKWTASTGIYGSPVTVTSNSASALAVGRQGATNPAFSVDASTASSVTGINVRSLAVGVGVVVSAISSGANESIVIDAKGSGAVFVGGNSTGAVVLGSGGGGLTATGAGGATINPGIAGTLDNMTIGATTPKPATVTSLNSGPLAGFRNRIINGDFQIDQVNAGATFSGIAAATQILDGWVAIGTAAAGVLSAAQATTTPPSGATTYLRLTVTTADAAPAAGATYILRQNIEGYAVRDLNFGLATAKQITLSFQLRTSITGTFSGSFRNSAANRSYPFTVVISAANTWTPVSVTLTGDATGTWLATNGIGLSLNLDLGSGSNFQGTAGAWAGVSNVAVAGATKLISTLNATYDVSEVQIEIGSVPTPFEARPVDTELMLVRRRYRKSFELATAPAQNAGAGTGEFTAPAPAAGAATERLPRVVFDAEMRAAPTITIYNPAAANAQVRDETAAADCSATTTANVTTKGFHVTAAGNAGTVVGGLLGFHWAADARL